MTEVTKKTYCDILSEHDGQRIAGAATYKDVAVMMPGDNGNTYYISKVTLDMCPACRAKYAINLFAQYDNRRQISYSFADTSAVNQDE